MCENLATNVNDPKTGVGTDGGPVSDDTQVPQDAGLIKKGTCVFMETRNDWNHLQ